ncbi:MAG: hypothetical protein M0C28_15745 [Candidatus Moduliflexus flocculans]|nr:hypothetical protein [Candidatus Moduliflexus flocculans]
MKPSSLTAWSGRATGLGMARGELSWVLENNVPMRAIAEKEIKADVYKRYRIFQKEF